jgi:hypothetical protein
MKYACSKTSGPPPRLSPPPVQLKSVFVCPAAVEEIAVATLPIQIPRGHRVVPWVEVLRCPAFSVRAFPYDTRGFPKFSRTIFGRRILCCAQKPLVIASVRAVTFPPAKPMRPLSVTNETHDYSLKTSRFAAFQREHGVRGVYPPVGSSSLPRKCRPGAMTSGQGKSVKTNARLLLEN